MATLRDIRRRINSVKSTQQITKAMKMVAAAKLRKAQDRLMNARPYVDRLDELLAHVTSKVDRSLHPLLEEREPGNVCYIIVTGDRGLCGSFNANVIRRAKSEIDGQEPDNNVMSIAIGKKGFAHFSRRNYEILKKYEGIFEGADLQDAADIAHIVEDLYRKKELDRVFLVYNEFKSVATQNVVSQQLLPILAKEPEIEKYRPADYFYEPSIDEILDKVCPRYLVVNIWRILLESFAAEQAARMVAMESATDNAEEMIYDLTLYYNKVRQAAITREIADIVGGAEALRG